MTELYGSMDNNNKEFLIIIKALCFDIFIMIFFLPLNITVYNLSLHGNKILIFLEAEVKL